MGINVLVPIGEGTEEIEACAIIDILRRANIKVTVASVSNLEITASRGVKLIADKLIDDCRNETFDLIVLPGGMPGAEHLRDCATLITMLKAQKAAGKLYAAICASPAVVLAPHGLLDDKKATCYPSLQEKLSNASRERVVVDGNCITSQGPGTAMEFAVELIRQLQSQKQADAVAAGLLMKS